jgi:hypothetical protein
MKTDLELFQLMSIRINSVGRTGLCRLSTELHYIGDIILEESMRIKQILTMNKPKTFYMLLTDSAYWWKPGKIRPRKRWLKKMIKRIKKKDYWYI